MGPFVGGVDPFIQGAIFELEVTGLTEVQLRDSIAFWRRALFTIRLTPTFDPLPTYVPRPDVVYLSSGEADFRLYDDGWRLDRLHKGEPELRPRNSPD